MTLLYLLALPALLFILLGLGLCKAARRKMPLPEDDLAHSDWFEADLKARTVTTGRLE